VTAFGELRRLPLFDGLPDDAEDVVGRHLRVEVAA
jgi:hypothetical protein